MLGNATQLGMVVTISSAGFGYNDQCRAQYAIGQQVALLQYADHGVGLLW